MSHLDFIESIMKNNSVIRKSSFGFLACMAVSALSFSLNASTKTTYPLKHQIQDLIVKSIPDAISGMMVMDAKTGRILYQHNGYQHFTPASTTKLFTAAATLYALKHDFTYKTAIYIAGKKIPEGKINDNLYFKFSGDPSLTDSNITTLIRKLQTKGIKHIRGNIIIDDSAFSGRNYLQGITLRDTQWSYGAPVSSIIINRNSVPFSISPGKALKSPVAVSISSAYHKNFPIRGYARTVSIPEANNSCEFNAEMDSQNNVTYDGCWPINTPAYKKLAIKNPEKFAVQVIKKALRENHIDLTGIIKTGKIPKHHTMIAEHSSMKLSSLVSYMLQFSDNLYANAFLKTLGAQQNKEGTFLKGVQALKKILSKHTDIDFNNMALFDGAGLSQYNLITPFQISQLLYSVSHSASIKKDYMLALAKPGQHGTLQNRMHTVGLNTSVKAKTGSLAGTSAIAGYLTTQNKQNLIFTIMINNYVGNTDTLRRLEDHVLGILHGYTFPHDQIGDNYS